MPRVEVPLKSADLSVDICETIVYMKHNKVNEITCPINKKLNFIIIQKSRKLEAVPHLIKSLRKQPHPFRYVYKNTGQDLKPGLGMSLTRERF